MTANRLYANAMIPHHSDYVRIFWECLANDFTTEDARAYAQMEVEEMEMDDRAARGELIVADFSERNETVDDNAMIDLGRAMDRAIADAETDGMPPLAPNPPGAPLKLTPVSQGSKFLALPAPSSHTSIPSFIKTPRKEKHRVKLEKKWARVSKGEAPEAEVKTERADDIGREGREVLTLELVDYQDIERRTHAWLAQRRLAQRLLSQRLLADRWPGTMTAID